MDNDFGFGADNLEPIAIRKEFTQAQVEGDLVNEVGAGQDANAAARADPAFTLNEVVESGEEDSLKSSIDSRGNEKAAGIESRLEVEASRPKPIASSEKGKPVD